MASTVAQPLTAGRTIARVLVDVGARQVDRLFDYLVPEQLDADAVVGARVRVHFSGRLVNGFILSRQDSSEFGAELKSLERVLGPAVLMPEIAELTHDVARAYVGTWSDVVRSAVPPRHVEAEKLVTAVAPIDVSPRQRSVDAQAYAELVRYVGGGAMVERLALRGVQDVNSGVDRGKKHEPTRVSFTVSPSADGEQLVAALGAGLPGTTLLLASDSRSLGRVRVALQRASGGDLRIEVLDSAESPRNRYSAFLRVVRGEVDVVLGTRDAVFAPIANLDRIVMWDEGSEHYRDQRSPYWHARRVALMRSHQLGCDLVLAGYSPSVEVADLVKSGWLKSIALPRDMRRDGVAEVVTEAAARASDFGGARVPGIAWRAIKSAVGSGPGTGSLSGPVLVSVPRAGYVRFMACAECDIALECPECGGAVQQASPVSTPTCAACHHKLEAPVCSECDSTDFRMASVGASRILEELRRAFPRTTIVESSAKEGVLARVAAEPQIVVATTGAEPVAEGRFQSAIVLDGMFTLRGQRLDAGQDAVHHWMRLAASTKAAKDGGTLVLTGNPTSRVVQAILRMDPIGWATHDLQERAELGLPPTAKYLRLLAPTEELKAFLEVGRLRLEQIPNIRILDSTSQDELSVAFVIAPAREGRTLTTLMAQLVHEWYGVVSESESGGGVGVIDATIATIPPGARELRVEVDPVAL